MMKCSRQLLLAAAICGLFLPNAGAIDRDPASTIKLFPLVYQRETPQEYDFEALFGLVGSHSEEGGSYSRRVVPFFWGDDHFHLAPLFWSWDDNWLLPPLAGRLRGTTAAPTLALSSATRSSSEEISSQFSIGRPHSRNSARTSLLWSQ